MPMSGLEPKNSKSFLSPLRCSPIVSVVPTGHVDSIIIVSLSLVWKQWNLQHQEHVMYLEGVPCQLMVLELQ